MLDLFFNLLYHQFAWMYDFVSWVVSWGQWREWIKTPIPHLRKGKILELGSGPGHLLAAGQDARKDLIGFDFSPQMLDLARQRLLDAHLPAPLIRGDGRTLPFQKGVFSQVVATFPTDYIFGRQTLSEIHRVLENEGEFLCVPMAWIREKGVRYRFLGWLFRFTGQSKTLDQIRLDKVIQVFSQSGFEITWEVVPHKHSDVLLFHAVKHNDAFVN